MSRTIELTDEERGAVRAALKDPARFHSDGREVAIACAMTPVLGVPLVIVLANLGLSSWRFRAPGVAAWRALLSPWETVHTAPELLGAYALGALICAIVFYGVRTWGRHGVLLLPFGVARIRGPLKSLIRPEDIERLTITHRRRPQYNVVTDELEARARDGRTISLFGFNTRMRKHQIEADLRARAIAQPVEGAQDT